MYNKNTHNNDISAKSLFWNFFFYVLKPFWKSIIGQAAITILYSMDLIIRPYLIKIIVDLIPIVESSGSIKELFFPIFLYILLIFFMFILMRFYDWIALTFRPHLIKQIGIMLMTRLINKPHKFFQNQFSGSLANKVGDVSNGVSDILSIFMDSFLSAIIMLLLAVYSIYYITPKLSVILVIWIIAFLYFSLKNSGRASEFSKNAAQKRSNVVGLIVDVLINMFSIRIFTTKTHEINILDKEYQKFIYSYQNRDQFFMKMQIMQGSSFIIYQILCFVWLLQCIKLKVITSGDFVFVMMLNISIINSLYLLSRNIRSLSEYLGNTMQGLQTIFTSSKNEKAALDSLQTISSEQFKVGNGEIRFINASFAYSETHKIFNTLSIVIPAKQKIGVVGYSGSGKTTFINLILGLFEINSGQILIDNQNISEVPKELLHRNISLIPQDIALFNRSLMENIRYGRIASSNEEVIEAAKQAKIHEFISSLPLSYNSLAGERGIKLSGGERQRIAIARAFLRNAPIILIDEATNQLDSITEHEIQKSLKTLMLNKTTIIIAHRLSTLLRLDRILVFDKGKIVQDGIHRDLIKENGLYKTLWENQSHGFLPING